MLPCLPLRLVPCLPILAVLLSCLPFSAQAEDAKPPEKGAKSIQAPGTKAAASVPDTQPVTDAPARPPAPPSSNPADYDGKEQVIAVDADLMQDSTLMQNIRLGPPPNMATVTIARSALSAAAAKQQALAIARREGLRKVLMAQDANRTEALLALIEPSQTERLVKRETLVDEENTTTTFKASIRLEYDAAQLQIMLGGPLKPLPAPPPTPVLTPAAGKASLVIPIWEEGGKLHIWEMDNPWRRALNRLALERGKGRLVMPYGDPIDQLAVTEVKLPTLNFAELAHLAARYGTEDVILARATPVAGNGINLHFLRLRAKDKSEQKELITDQPNTPRDALLAKAAELLMQMERAQFRTPQEAAQEAESKSHRILASAAITRADDWVGMRNRLLALPMVESLTPINIGPDRVEMEIGFHGSPQAFGESLKAADIHVAPQGDKLVLGFYPVVP